MLGYIGEHKDNSNNILTCTHGPNARAVNLKPWDVVIDVKKSKLYPEGKRVIPAASQDDFKAILEAVPERKHEIGELAPEQEKRVIDSLSKNCAWYKEQNGLNKQKSEDNKK